LSYYRQDEAEAKAKAKLESLQIARNSQMKRYWTAYIKLSERMGIEEILDIFCKYRDSVMYTNWCYNGAYFLSDDNVRRVFNNIISTTRSEEDRINRPSFNKKFG